MKLDRKTGMVLSAGQLSAPALIAAENVRNKIRLNHHWRFEAFSSEGDFLWDDEFDNLVVNEGLNDYLDKYYKGSTYTAAHYVGLADGTPSFAAGDTMSTHAGWTEVTAYSEGARQTFTPGTVASQSVDNSGSVAAFSINGSTTVGGGFLSTDNTKGGTAGILVGGNAFSGGDRTLNNGDTLNVTVTASLTSS